MNLKPRVSAEGKVEPIENGWRLSIPSGSASRYRLSQLDDHLRIARKDYPCRPPITLSVEARVSAERLPGTWGFGFWNDPYGFSFGPGDGFLRLPALPNAAWFFSSSPRSFLSFRDDKPGNGFLAQLFSSPRFDMRLIQAVLAAPFSLRTTRRAFSRIIAEDGVQLDAPQGAAGLDPTQWHRYSIDWRDSGVSFLVDGSEVLGSALSPRGPLGLVIWIDNQRAAFDPQAKLTFGLEVNAEPAWMDIRDLSLT